MTNFSLDGKLDIKSIGWRKSCMHIALKLRTFVLIYFYCKVTISVSKTKAPSKYNAMFNKEIKPETLVKLFQYVLQ